MASCIIRETPGYGACTTCSPSRTREGPLWVDSGCSRCRPGCRRFGSILAVQAKRPGCHCFGSNTGIRRGHSSYPRPAPVQVLARKLMVLDTVGLIVETIGFRSRPPEGHPPGSTNRPGRRAGATARGDADADRPDLVAPRDCSRLMRWHTIRCIRQVPIGQRHTVPCGPRRRHAGAPRQPSCPLRADHPSRTNEEPDPRTMTTTTDQQHSVKIGRIPAQRRSPARAHQRGRAAHAPRPSRPDGPPRRPGEKHAGQPGRRVPASMQQRPGRFRRQHGVAQADQPRTPEPSATSPSPPRLRSPAGATPGEAEAHAT